MNKPLLVIFIAVMLDAAGIGLIFPILPSLLRDLTGQTEISTLYGVILALYASMQFLFSPLLGVLSDRFGRRPVLLASVGGATIDYLVMALVPSLWVVIVGRMLAGFTSANMAVATAYIADITSEDERARRFGQMGACFGIGFIIGPLLGGFLGTWWVHAPFLAAAVLNGVNFALALFVLPESHKPDGGRLAWAALNPLAPMRWALGFRELLPLILIFFILALVGNIPGTVWVLYGQDKFGWDGLTVGLSLAVFGLCHAGAQAFITGPLSQRFGELRAMALGMATDGLGYVLMGFATQGWMPFALGPLFAVGGIAPPSVQALMTRQVSEDKQGQLQGVLASVTSLTAIIGPLVGTSVYYLSKPFWPGIVWIVGASLYLFAIPLLALGRRRLQMKPA
ncbi:MAG TPA: Tet(A)/Tet(B)/Tet(C) family tetracycline efflux MFS transporter [Devosiaceae bacterium]|jgi:DHA1 family tetracycline resistance protein-like MFS transporter